MKAAHRRWHPWLWLVLGSAAAVVLGLGVAWRSPSIVPTIPDDAPRPPATEAQP